MQKKYLNLFFFLLIFYNTTIYLFPPIVLYFLGNNNIISDFTVLIYPILFLTLLTFLFIIISKLRVLRLKSKLPFYFPIELGFLIWILISIILLASNNLTMSVVEKNKIPFLSIFKNFNSLGIIFSVFFSREYKKKTISFIYFIFYYIIILFFTILTLSKFLIILNLVIPFLINFKEKKTRIILALIFSILFIPFFLYLSDLRSSISADVNISVISEIRTEPYGFTDFFLDRLNYFQTFNRSIETKYEFTSNPYLDNFYSIIPRILWKKKKNIGLNTNSFGRELGILDSKDENTSLGIGIITESYIVYKYFGLLIVLIYGTLFLLIKFINSEIFSIILIINFIFLDSFSYFISIMIYVILFSLFFKSLKI